jgi:hypothetical protein
MKKNVFEMIGKVMLTVLAAVTGGAAMAGVLVGAGADSSVTSGEDASSLEGVVNANPVGLEVPGGAATGSAVEELDQAVNEIDDYVAKFQSHKYPMHTDFMTVARQIKVDTKEPIDYEIGEGILDAVTTAETGSDSDKNHTVQLHVSNSDAKLFVKGSTVIVEGVQGRDDRGAYDDAPLMLYVEGNTAGVVTVSALNGPLNGSDTYVPLINSGSKLHILAPALSESEVEIAPDAAYPMPKQHYLQKKVCAITYTDLFARIKKKARWNVQDLKDWQLDQFRRKCTRSMLIGVGAKFKKYNEKTGYEDAYTQKGVLRQIRLAYQPEDYEKWKYSDLIAISKMAFGKFATTDVVDAYCGSGAIEKLLNVDLTSHREIIMNSDKKVEANLTTLKTTFGTINFKHEHALDDLGMEDCMVIFAMKDAKRFVYEGGKTINVDHSKGEGGEVREAKSSYYIQDDCLALRSYNSMIVAPNIATVEHVSIEKVVTSGSVLPATTSHSEGDLFYVASGNNGAGLYELRGGAWVAYDGDINA